jgi:hypothetical protein
MKKRTLWYAGLVLLCCLTLVFVVQASGVAQGKYKAPVTTGSSENPVTNVAPSGMSSGGLNSPVRSTTGVTSATRPNSAPALTSEQVAKQEIARALERMERGVMRPGDKELLTPYFESLNDQQSGNPLDNTGGPDAFGYRYVDSVSPDTATYNWIELCGEPGATDGPTGDDASLSASWGWNFPFYGSTYTSVNVSTNGLMTFTGTNTSWTNLCPFATGNPTYPEIAPYWDDFYASGSGGCNQNGTAPWIRWKDFGSYFVVQWDIPHLGETTSRFKLEAILYPDGKIKMQYNTITTTTYPNSGSIGIDAPGANNGVEYLTCNLNTLPSGTTGLAVWFYPGAQQAGRCCYGDPLNPSCADNLPTECAALSGTWTGGMTCANNPCPGCADFSLTAPGTVSGNTAGAGDNCNLRVGDDQVVAVTIPTAGVWYFELCTTSPAWDTYLYLSATCCGPYLALDDDGCGYPLSRITYNIPTAGTYFIDVEPFSAGTTGAWTLVVSAAPPPPDNDLCTNAVVVPSFPYTYNGNNGGATSTCTTLGWPGEVWFTFTSSEACNLNISLCGTTPAFATGGIVLFTQCPCEATYIVDTSYNFTDCTDGNISIYWINLPAGTYYYPMYSGAGSMGPYTINFTCEPYVPCDVVSTGEPEGEPCPLNPDTYNGGCNSTPNVFQNVACDAHIAGTSYFDGSTRDTDWYQVHTPVPNNFTMTVTAEFDLQILIITPGTPDPCTGFTYVIGTGMPCQTVSLSSGPVPAGDYWFWVGPQFTTIFDCGEYDMVLSSEAPCACQPAENVTVRRTPGEATNTVNVRWYATSNVGIYRLYATTEKNNDGDPDNGSDPQWTLIADVPAPAAPGGQLYVDTPLVPYANYVVVHDCAPRGRCCYGDPMAPSCQSPVTEAECDALAGSFDEGLNCTDNPCTACADFTLTAPGSLTGNTTGAGDDCTLNAGEEQVVAVTIPTDGQWTFSLCDGGTDYDSWLDLATTCCGAPFASNDDYCGLQSELHCLQLTAGTYYLAIEGFSTATGNWSLDVTACEPPPPLECPPGATMENEPLCGDEYVDVTNGGCNSTPNVFQPISCGETICGESGTYLYTGLNYRDTDWFELTITEPSNVTWSVQASFDLLIFTIGAPCPGTIRLQAQAAPLEVATITDYMTPGTYYLWVGPSVFTGIPCGSDWVGTVTCEPAGGAYCPASHTYGCDEYIGTVTFNTINNVTDCGVSPYYEDYTAISTTLTTGQSYPITVLNGGNLYSTDAVSVWIDWNDNYTLNDAGEQYDLTNDGTGYQFTGNIVAGAAGSHRMRVRMGYSWTPDPCGATSYGETEDYTVVVQ